MFVTKLLRNDFTDRYEIWCVNSVGMRIGRKLFPVLKFLKGLRPSGSGVSHVKLMRNGINES